LDQPLWFNEELEPNRCFSSTHHPFVMVHTTLVAIDENLPNMNKTKHPKKKKKKVQMGRTQVEAKRKNHRQGQIALGT
jgi:hypothetical protein